MDKDTTTFGVVKGSDYVTTTADEDSNTVKVDVSNKVKDAVTTVEEKGLTFAGETGSTNVQKLGSTVNVTGDDYIDTSAAENTITVTASDKTKKAVDTVEKGLTITSSASTGENKGITTDNLKLDETFNYDAGDNIALTQSDNGLSIATKKDVTFTTVNATTVNGDTVNSKVVNVTNNGGTTTIDGNHITTNNVTINGDVTNETDATTKKYVDDGRTTVTSSDESISVVDNNTDEKINNYDIKVDYNKVAENTDLTYKDNGGADKTVKLKKGLDFVNTTNITMETLADGVVKASLNSALTSITSISNGNTTITLGDTTNTVNVGGAKITNVTNGVDNNDAVNVSQLKAAKTEVKAGNNVKVDTSTATDGHTVYTVSTDLSKLGSMSSFNVANKDETVKSNITDSETVKFTNDGNLTTTVTDEANGSTVTYGLANNVNVGGKDGKDGSVGVKGANGKDGVTITATGADGQDGVDGHIGINGKDGASADMHVKNGSNGVDGTDGKNGTNGMDRIVYEDHNHVTHEVATMDDGLKFTGNNTATENVHKLNTTVKVQGEGTQAGADKTKVYKADGTEFESATGNIAVVADGTDTLTVKLNKDLKNLNSVTATTINGDTINANNMYVTNAPTTNTSVVNKQYADNMGWNIGYDESENDIKNVGKVVNNNTVNFKGIEGTAVKVKTDDAGTYTVEIKAPTPETVVPTKVFAGTNATVDQGKNADGSLNHDYTVNAYDTKVTTSDSNITLTGGELDSSNNVRTYDIALGNDIQIGKDGKNGTIGVNGADGRSGVGIDGKDGISVYGKDGKDGKDAVAINGKDGVGHIGLTGGNGTDGVDGSSADISVRNGKNGVDGTDGNNGTNGMDRIVYEDHNHVTHEVATMDDGLKFGANEAAQGSTANPVANKLNSQVDIVGAGTKDISNYSGENLKTTVVQGADGKTTINVLMDNDLATRSLTAGGKDGVNGTNGTDGKIGVDGKNGKNGVTITAVGATGADGQDGANGTIGVNGVDGASVVINGKDGSIGLTGPKGADGSNGVSATMKVVQGPKGLAGNDGANGETKTRIEYVKPNGEKEEVATLNDGLNFTGNNTDTINAHKLNTTVKIVGEGTTSGSDKTKAYKDDGSVFESATGNIAVIANGTDTLMVELSKNLVNLNSVTATTINGDTIKAGNMYVTNVDGDNDNSVINKKYFDEHRTKVDSTDKTVKYKYDKDTNTYDLSVDTSKLGTMSAFNVTDGEKIAKIINNETVKFANDGNLTTTVEDTAEGSTVTYGLSNTVNLGGKDGKNGTIGVNGSDGKSGVGIDGKDGIIVYGKDGKDGTNAVSINGKDGVGHIGLTGGNGKDGVDGSSADISVRNGKNGVDGTDGNNGKNGMDRIVYEDHNHVTHEVATMDDGQIYGGDAEAANLTNGKSATGKEIKKKLNEQVNVIGGVSDETKLTKEDNLGVVSDGTNNLKVRLAKDLKLGKDGSVTIGDTIIKSGDIKVGDTHIEGDKITAKNMYVTNVDNKPNSVTNKKYVDEGRTKVTSSDSSILVDHNKTTNTYDIKVDGESIVANAKLTYKASGGNDQSVKLKDGLNFTNGDNDNIKASVGADGKVKHDLNKDLKNMTSVETVDGNGNKNTMNAAGNTIVNVDGSKTEITAGSTTYTSKEGDKTIIDGKGVHMGDVSVTKNGLDNGNKQIINQASGATEIKQNGTRVYNKDTNGANIGDVKYLAGDIVNNEIKTLKTDAFGVKDTDGKAIKKNLGDQVDIVGKGTKANSEYDASNIKTFVEDGKLVVGLDKNIKADSVTVGEKGKDGKPGKDGYIGVDGKDGSSVAINGKDGSIGLTGPKGADGKDGASANISVKNGTKGLDGNDGKNGESKTRIEYVKPNGEKEEIATLNDGLNFKGNNEVVNKQKLNSTVTIAGEGVDKAASEKFESAAGNVNVKADGKGKLEVQLAKKLKNLESAEFKQGNKSTTINGGSMTINNGAQSTTISSVAGKDANGKTINAVSVNGSQIKHVANGVEDHDAVNVSQLRSGLADVHNHVNKVDKQLRAGVAGANAAAGLPQAYMPGKSMVAASAGAYRGESALAVGYSRASDNGKLVLKLQGNTNSRGDVGGSVGVGYQW
ncbi:YadA-like family protein [Pasteurella bettyae]|uniref:YadA-like family protein n=1 Tax=Pasteurella bettyae TaxID=752 RepID=UPI003D2C458D